MKKLMLITLLFSTTSLFAGAQDNTTDEGVEINGLIWATRNVDAPGTFAENLEDAGMFYQWNGKIGWSATDPMINSNESTIWNSHWNGNYENPSASDVWQTKNNICPAGWRVPTITEFESLLNSESEWTETPVSGITFKNNDNILFLPAVGYRGTDAGTLFNADLNGYYGSYWSSTGYKTDEVYDRPTARDLFFGSEILPGNNGIAVLSTGFRGYGQSVRCVSDKIPNSINNISLEKQKNITGYYSILGEKLPKEPASGFYIILYDNGTSEKRIK